MPTGVNQAVIAIWITIGLSVAAALINRWIGEISSGEFMWYIIVYAILCVFPYKLSKGSNPARWVYAIFFAVSILFMLGGVSSDMPKADWIVSIITLPIEIFIIYRLFQAEASLWFKQH
ncbi:hypothetical protein [Neptuniibacter sp. 2_MG-2023]|uniref:hypothetical protein n=1 Tax=Neptuniibacter sp. 2_MG-2023 TaxID=3062671 RepID=UPI0026E312A6|nr:hypothetical protein [Neptuniibacter sp. 2_MG-2023]MDO6514566.1 hypothetical protein [Neptuniibacter sp. 2_MG-2023]